MKSYVDFFLICEKYDSLLRSCINVSFQRVVVDKVTQFAHIKLWLQNNFQSLQKKMGTFRMFDKFKTEISRYCIHSEVTFTSGK